jgi:hypothetical protein
MAAPQQITVRVPEEQSNSPAKRESLAQEIIEFIRNRTREGTGARRRGRGFQNYSLSNIRYTKEYAAFKGVGRSDVDLTLSGEMLDNIQHIKSKSRRGEITVGYRAGTKLNAKVEGNQDVHRRPFLGITRADLLTLL